MVSTAQLVFILIGYSVMLGIMIAALSVGGQFENSNMIQGGSLQQIQSTFNVSEDVNPASVLLGSVWLDVQKFSNFGIDLGLGGFGNFLVSFIFVWLPAFAMIILIYYSIRSGSS